MPSLRTLRRFTACELRWGFPVTPYLTPGSSSSEIAALAKAGCTYIQLDDTNLAYLCSEEMREGATARGEDVQAL